MRMKYLTYICPLAHYSRQHCWVELFLALESDSNVHMWCSHGHEFFLFFKSDATFLLGLEVDFSLLWAGGQFESKAKVVIRVWGIIMENPQETSFSEAKLNLPPCLYFCPSVSSFTLLSWLCICLSPTPLLQGEGFKCLCVCVCVWWAGCGFKIPQNSLYTQP